MKPIFSSRPSRVTSAPGRLAALPVLSTALLFCTAAACRLFPEWEDVTVRLPEPPAAWSGCGLSPDWEVRAFWFGGRAVSAAGSGGRASLLLPRGERAAVLAYPIRAGRELRPAGAVYPSDGEGYLALSWEGGYRAEAARVLIRAGVDPGRFDLDRFAREALTRLGDPWHRPPEVFAESLAAETFRVTWLDPPKLFAASVGGLPGSAASESPFGPGLVPDEEGQAAASLPPGVHRWYADWGRVSVEVDEGGAAVWVVKVDSGP